MKISLVQHIRSGMMLPRFYGVAWVDYLSGEAVCMPIPINLLAGAARAFGVWLRWGWLTQGMSDRNAFAAGVRRGREEAFSNVPCGDCVFNRSIEK